DVDENRHRIAIADGVGRRYEGMTDGDDLMPRPDADCPQSQMQRRRAIRHRAGIWSARQYGEILFESSDFRPLCHPTREDDATRGFRLALVKHRPCHRYFP